jgi:hypothetical protein
MGNIIVGIYGQGKSCKSPVILRVYKVGRVSKGKAPCIPDLDPNYLC